MYVFYSNLTLYFPEYFDSGETGGFNKKSVGDISGNTISFTTDDFDGFLFEAKIYQYCLPLELSDNKYVQKKIINPVIETVVTDIKTVKDLLDDLRELGKQEKTEKRFHYIREDDGKCFRVYNYMIYTDNDMFEKLQKFKNIPSKVLTRKYKDFPALARHIRKKGKEFAYVEGSTLREATERILKIYNLAETINKIPFD